MNNVEGPDANLAQRLDATYGSFYFMGCNFLNWCYSMLGDYVRAFQYADRAAQAAERIESPQAQANALFYRAVLLNSQGAFARAMPLCERAVPLYETHGIRFMVPVALMYWGQALAWAGRLTEGLHALEQAVTLQKNLETRALTAMGYILWAEGHLLAGHIEEARRVANRGVALARELGERAHEAWALQVLGAILAAEKPSDSRGAVGSYRQAEMLAAELGMRPLQAHCHRGLGILYRQIGQVEQARAELSTAIEMYRNMEMTFWLPETEATLADVAG